MMAGNCPGGGKHDFQPVGTVTHPDGSAWTTWKCLKCTAKYETPA